MDFQAPEPADLANARALNRAFVELIAADGKTMHLPPAQTDTVARICELGPTARERLAEVPFLLLSLGYSDERWRGVFEGRREPDLLRAVPTPSSFESSVTTAAIGYLWQLCNVRPYVARMLSGADADWCSRFSEVPLVELNRFASTSRGLLGLRRGKDTRFWRRLLASATSPETQIRRAARMSSMQILLTTGRPAREDSLRAAACSMPEPVRRIDVSPPAVHRYNTPPDEGTRNRKTDEDVSER